jgi:predicted phosphodiesterase
MSGDFPTFEGKTDMIFRILIFILLCFPGILSARILMSPYLQAVSQNSVFVLIECDSREPALVVFGSGAELQDSAITTLISETTGKPATYIHKVHVEGLAPATKYYYQVFQGGTSSQIYNFYTAVEPGTPFRMVWMADSRTGTDIFSKISRLMKQADPMVALYGGDLCMNGSYEGWKKEFFIREQLDFISTIPFFNTPGNHEGWKPETKAFTHNPDEFSGTQDFYSFDYGDVHVLSLNTEIPMDTGSTQFKFAAKDLAATTRKWKIVMAHEPAYCSGGHRPNPEMKMMTTMLFEPLGVDIVLAGHSHFYQHNLVNGIHHFVPGSAGAPLYKPKKASFTVFQAKTWHYMVMDVSSSKIKVFVYDYQGELLEMSEVEKSKQKSGYNDEIKKCRGYFRWDVKTLTDPLGEKVLSTACVDTTIEDLVSAKRPGGMCLLSAKAARMARRVDEMQLVRVRAWVRRYNIQRDQDYHILVSSGEGTQMVCEIPDPRCEVFTGFPGLADIFKNARDEFSPVITRLNTENQPVEVELIGVPFWDARHWWLRGTAKNGRELHPVISVKIL